MLSFKVGILGLFLSFLAMLGCRNPLDFKLCLDPCRPPSGGGGGYGLASIKLVTALDTIESQRGDVLVAVVLDSGGRQVVPNTPISWAITSPTILTFARTPQPFNSAINKSVLGVSAGSTEITATVGGLHASATVTVQGGPVDLTVVNAGGHRTCGITAGGGAYCWGAVETRGGYASTYFPMRVPTTLSFSTISSGSGVSLGVDTCALTPAGSAFCWGSLLPGGGIDYPVAVAGGYTFDSVSVGGTQVCGLVSGGGAYCWGNNSVGQLGGDSSSSSLQPVPVAGGLAFTMISASGNAHVCGVAAAGAAYCWGDNGDGQLGNGSRLNSATPAAVSGGVNFVAVSTGFSHTCGVTPAGAGYCWGANNAGQLGTGDTTASLTPVAVTGGLVFASISAGDSYSCGVTTNGKAYCWGSNSHGELGVGDSSAAANPTPLAVSGGLTFQSVSGSGDQTCGVTTRGVTYCWGANDAGQVGDGVGYANHVAPVRVFGQP